MSTTIKPSGSYATISGTTSSSTYTLTNHTITSGSSNTIIGYTAGTISSSGNWTMGVDLQKLKEEEAKIELYELAIELAATTPKLRLAMLTSSNALIRKWASEFRGTKNSDSEE